MKPPMCAPKATPPARAAEQPRLLMIWNRNHRPTATQPGTSRQHADHEHRHAAVRMQHEIAAHHAGDRPRSAEAGNLG